MNSHEGTMGWERGFLRWAAGILLIVGTTVLVVLIFAREPEAVTRVSSDMEGLLDAYARFREDKGRWPHELDELLTTTSAGGGRYANREWFVDPWGAPYLISHLGLTVTMKTLGADGRPGGRGLDRDREAKMWVHE